MVSLDLSWRVELKDVRSVSIIFLVFVLNVLVEPTI